MAMLRAIVAICLVAVVQVRAEDAAAAAPAADAAAAGAGCTFTSTLPWTYDAGLSFQLNNYIKEHGVLEVQTACTIPPATSGVYTSSMTCTGTLPSDCDPYAQSSAYLVSAGEKFGSVFLHMDEETAKGTIAFAFFWAILGTVLIWLGILILLYSEIKAVVIFREKDERNRLVHIKILIPIEAKMKALDDEDDDKLAPRPYLTVIGMLLFSFGMFFQWLPLCDAIGLIFPGYWCILFVFLAALLLSTTALLFIVGLCWSCTRGWAALLLIVLSLFGNLMLFGGIIPIVVFILILGAACYAYFIWAPNYYKDQNEPKPTWLQSLGKEDFYVVALDAETFKQNMEKGGRAATAEGREALSVLPGGKQVLEAADKTKALADEAAEKAKAYADEQAAKVKQAAGGLGAAEPKPPQSGSV